MNAKKLSLNRETLRVLRSDEADQAAGGLNFVTLFCRTLVCPNPTLTTITATRVTCVCGDPSPHPD